VHLGSSSAVAHDPNQRRESSVSGLDDGTLSLVLRQRLRSDAMHSANELAERYEQLERRSPGDEGLLPLAAQIERAYEHVERCALEELDNVPPSSADALNPARQDVTAALQAARTALNRWRRANVG
jgi:hypothetical protein